jgi:chitinase
MTQIRRLSLALISLTALFVLLGSATAQENFPRYRVVGYYSFYSLYEPFNYDITEIPAHLLTHLIYANIDISANGQCESLDEYADTEYEYPGDRDNERLKGNFKQLQILKEDNPDLKIMMSVGGWEQSEHMSDTALTQESRIRFARSCLAFMREYGFDGIDIDWRFPVSGGMTNGRTADKENFIYLLDEFNGQFEYWSERDGVNYSLSITAPAVPELYAGFDLAEIATRIDFINLMSYSFEGSWSRTAAHQAPINMSDYDPRDAETQSDFTINGAVNNFLNAGVPAEKLVIGVGLFGQAWRNVRPNDFFGLFSTTDGVPSGTRPGGLLYYSDMAEHFINSPNYIRFFDESAGVPWMYNESGRIGISYENSESIQRKAAYVKRMGLGGIMIWQLAYDDRNATMTSTVASSLNGIR